MANIGEVIGWKFNHQAGMATSDGVITEFPGGIPSVGQQAQWTAEHTAWIASGGRKDAQVESEFTPALLAIIRVMDVANAATIITAAKALRKQEI